ncbi:hypothetical protein OVS_00690 [Mycoplasma ovis str. Michigan]|uniref:Trans-sialidase n=1 Tax=Mycoplasma ovis str. Michigan TaxID=1415773 RepID=A0ABM5P189_9MOLU|nr:hypothetical protein OVS_00690 [Mycoplasma ovis str. Michigan]
MKGENGNTQIIDLSENTCIVNVGSMNLEEGIHAYLVVGFAQGRGKNGGGGKYRLSWENADKNFLVKNYGCKNLPWHTGSNLRLRPDWSWNTGEGNWSARGDSMIVLGNDSGIIQIGGEGDRPIVAVVLGLVYNKVTVKWKNRTKSGWEKASEEGGWRGILKDESEEWKKHPWREGETECFAQSGRKVEVRIEEGCLKTKARLDAFKGWKANLKLTYSYELEQ